MKKTLLTFTTLLVLTTLTLPALALGPLDLDADLTVMSKYVWRGMVANPDAVLQPSLGASILGFGINVWGNMDLTDANGMSSEFNEVDWLASYSLPLPLVDVDFGFIYYDFPNTDNPSTAEAFIKGSVGVLLSPTLEIYYDFQEIDGTYFNANISHPVALGEKFDLELGAALGYGDSSYSESYFGVRSSSTTDFNLTASIPWKPIPFFTITPSAAYSTLMSDAKTAVSGNGRYHGDTEAVYYGLSATFSF